MALNFPSNVPNGTVFTDPNTGTQWVYSSSTNSWTSKGLVNTNGGITYKGSVDITASPPAGFESGDMYSVEATGTANAGYAGISGDIIQSGSFIIFDGAAWVILDISSYWTKVGDHLEPIDAGNDVEIGGGNITLFSSGVGTFSGEIKAGERNPAATDTRGVRIAIDSSNGGCYVQAKSSSTASSLMAFQALHGTSERFKVMYDGSVNTLGAVKIGGTLPSSPSISLNSNGSSSFAGQMEIGGDIATSSAARIYSNGALYLRSDVGTTNSIFKYYNGGFGDATTRINFKADGSAIFSGPVTASNITAFRSKLRTAIQSASDLSAVKAAILDALDDL